jgi:hypothetical protein
VAAFIEEQFVPLRAHIKQRAALFHQFSVLWTPTVLFLDSATVERRRSEGYLPRQEFFAELHHGVARLLFLRKRWPETIRAYDEIVSRFGDTAAAAEAMYWAGVSRYSQSHDHHVLGELAAQFERQHQHTLWARKASIWRTP